MSHAKPDKPLTKLYVNNSIRSDLLWAIDHLSRLPGMCILKSVDWDTSNADLTVYCDASLTGLGFWFPELCVGFWLCVPEDPPKGTIFYFEALSVLSAIVHSTSLLPQLTKLVVYTNNLNTVHMFNSLSALPAYNEILKNSSTLHSPTSPIRVRLDSSDSDRIPSSPSSVRAQSDQNLSSVRSESELSPRSV